MHGQKNIKLYKIKTKKINLNWVSEWRNMWLCS